jgi:hypothetical protein
VEASVLAPSPPKVPCAETTAVKVYLPIVPVILHVHGVGCLQAASCAHQAVAVMSAVIPSSAADSGWADDSGHVESCAARPPWDGTAQDEMLMLMHAKDLWIVDCGLWTWVHSR